MQFLKNLAYPKQFLRAWIDIIPTILFVSFLRLQWYLKPQLFLLENQKLMRLDIFRSGILLFLAVLTLQSSYKKILHDSNPEAKCLDGTPAIMYIDQGKLKDHITLFLLGGGTCGSMTKEKTIESCYERSMGRLGSSSVWPSQLPKQYQQGYLSPDLSKNNFANWTKIFVPYCDGAFHQGYRKEPVNYNGTKLYFRGSANTRAHIKWIDSHYDLKSVSKVVLTGMSSGGIATNSWSNYLKGYVGDANKVYSISDSGFFNNFQAITKENITESAVKNIIHIANVDQNYSLTQCAEYYKEESWRCVFMQYAYPFIKGRFMTIFSQYDSWAILYDIKIECPSLGVSGYTLKNCNSSELEYIQKYRSLTLQTLRNFRAVNSQVSVWSIACSQHVYACYDDFYSNLHQKAPAAYGVTVREAVEAFVLYDQQVVYIDQFGWPYNAECAW